MSCVRAQSDVSGIQQFTQQVTDLADRKSNKVLHALLQLLHE